MPNGRNEVSHVNGTKKTGQKSSGGKQHVEIAMTIPT
jgi:hypothetical protein